jgi:predicted Zn-ribbon and HTH transcriptional regulator
MTCDGILFGLQDGQVKYISEVERGSACNCVCPSPSCRAPLVAKKGPKNIHHFAHASGTACEGAHESALHYAAKRIICEASHITIPTLRAVARCGEYPGDGGTLKSETIFKSKAVKIRSVTEEVWLDNMQPDIIVIIGNNSRELLVEIAVTHFVDAEKLQKIKHRNIPAIEIDLSRLSRDASFEEIRVAVLSGNNSKWLFSSVRDQKEAELQLECEDQQREIQRLRNEQERRTQEEIRKIRREYERIANKKDDDVRTQETKAFNVAELPDSQDLDRLGVIGPAPHFLINHSVSGEQFFRCPRSVWQARILIYFSQFVQTTSYNIISLLHENGCISDAIWKIHRWKDDCYMRSNFDDINLSLVHVVESYLEFLHRKRILQYAGISGAKNVREYCLSVERYTPESLDDLRFVCRLFLDDQVQQRSLSSRYFQGQRDKLLKLSEKLDPLRSFQIRLNRLSQRLYQIHLIYPYDARLRSLVARMNRVFESQFSTRGAVDSVFRRNHGAVVCQLHKVKEKLEQRLREFDGVILDPDTADRKGAQCIDCGYKFWVKVDPSTSRCPECFNARVISCQMVSPRQGKTRKLSPLVVLPKRRQY